MPSGVRAGQHSGEWATVRHPRGARGKRAESWQSTRLDGGRSRARHQRRTEAGHSAIDDLYPAGSRACRQGHRRGVTGQRDPQRDMGAQGAMAVARRPQRGVGTCIAIDGHRHPGRADVDSLTRSGGGDPAGPRHRFGEQWRPEVQQDQRDADPAGPVSSSRGCHAEDCAGSGSETD